MSAARGDDRNPCPEGIRGRRMSITNQGVEDRIRRT